MFKIGQEVIANCGSFENPKNYRHYGKIINSMEFPDGLNYAVEITKTYNGEYHNGYWGIQWFNINQLELP